jgi:hypothetical protein
MLPSLGGFTKLESIGNVFTINAAGSLTGFAGLGALEVVSGDMNITNNPQISSFAGLGAFDEVGEDLTITGNSSLPRPIAQAFANGITVRGTVTIN